ncbi:ARSI [Bugula neritina]|uniref:ARSI n=1 Tax=Bugula neritina TaxID=10212 RepID=A0A7J7KC98_BUGNE|nr:ARSI [Bugula neritina]
MKVAGFVSSPLLSAPKTVSHEWMHVSDWYPTILNLAGGSTEGLTLDGFDQWPAISGSAPSPRKELLHNIDPLMQKYGARKEGSPFDNRQTAALRVGDYKIVTGFPMQDGWYKPASLQGAVQ